MKTLLRVLALLAPVVAAALLIYRFYLTGIRYHAYDAAIAEAARTHGVDPALVSAVVWRESRFDPYEVGSAGEAGLMQVGREAAGEWAASQRLPASAAGDRFDPGTNLAMGTWYLARAIRRWGGKADPLPYALAEYNAGRSNAIRWDGPVPAADPDEFRRRIDYPSTRRYIDAVLERHRRTRR